MEKRIGAIMLASALAGCTPLQVNDSGTPLQYTMVQPPSVRQVVYGSNIPDPPDNVTPPTIPRQESDEERLGREERDRLEQQARKLSLPCKRATGMGAVAAGPHGQGAITLMERARHGSIDERERAFETFPLQWHDTQFGSYCTGLSVEGHAVQLLVEPYDSSWLKQYDASVLKTYVLGLTRLEFSDGRMHACEVVIAGYKAVVEFQPGSGLYRGEFLGLNGGADFYAADEVQLRVEGARSLAVFLAECERRGITPRAKA
jgi:hypothetical protein